MTASDAEGRLKLRRTCRVLGLDYEEALAEAQALAVASLRPLGDCCITLAHSLFEQDRYSSHS